MILMRMNRRWLLGVTLVAGVIGGLWRYGGEPATAALAHPARPSAAAQAGASSESLPEIDLSRLDVQKSDAPITDAFEPRSWVPPAPRIKMTPAPPQAPPLPFIYVGKMMEDGRIVVFLSSQDRNYAVRSGDRLDGNYQVDDIKPTMMLLTYLPLNLQQSLAIGSAN
ncbi:MAG: type secretion system, translation initiation factor [Betaproteobacteria bacterium]|nr:type secretion system, translation initiation factor [Betaproteobacteria bacterium]